MKRATLISSLLVAMTPGVSFAEFNYSKVEVAVIDVEVDVDVGNGQAVSVDGDGFEISGAWDVSNRVFLHGSWQDQSFDFDVDGEALELGVGLKHEINSDLDFVGTLSYHDVELSYQNLSASDDGLGLGAGVRARLGDSFEIDALLEYVDFDEADSDTGITVNGRYYFSDMWALSFGTDMADNVDTLRIGIRAEF